MFSKSAPKTTSRQPSLPPSNFGRFDSNQQSPSRSLSRRNTAPSLSLVGAGKQGKTKPLARRPSLTPSMYSRLNNAPVTKPKAASLARKLSIISEASEPTNFEELFGPSPGPTPTEEVEFGSFGGVDNIFSPEYIARMVEEEMNNRNQLLQSWGYQASILQRMPVVPRGRSRSIASATSTFTADTISASDRTLRDICFTLYDDSWRQLVNSETMREGSFEPYLRFWDLPWPMFQPIVMDQHPGSKYNCPFTRKAWYEFVYHPERLEKRGLTPQQIAWEEQMLWAVSNFDKRIFNKIVPQDLGVVLCAYQLVCSYMNCEDDEAVQKWMGDMNRAVTLWTKDGHFDLKPLTDNELFNRV